MAVLCCGLENNGMVGAWHGHGMASVNQTGPHCVNQMGKTHSKSLAAWHGNGTAWARCGNSMQCVNRPLGWRAVWWVVLPAFRRNLLVKNIQVFCVVWIVVCNYRCFERSQFLHSFWSIILVFPLIQYTRLSCAAVLLRLLDHENENITILWNVDNCSPNERVSHSIKLESSATLLWEPQTSLFLLFPSSRHRIYNLS